MLGQDVASAAAALGPRRDRALARRARHHRCRRGAAAVRRSRARCRDQLRCLDQRRRRRVTRRDGARRQRRRRRQRGARRRRGAGAWTVHVSSDYVFDGANASRTWSPTPTGPLSAYGRSKLAGELAVARGGARRSTRSFAPRGCSAPAVPAFPTTILRLAGERDRAERRRRPGRLPDLHRPPGPGAGRAAPSGASPPASVHVAGGGSCSWYDFATEIVAAPAASTARSTPGTTDDSRAPGAASRLQRARDRAGATRFRGCPTGARALADFIATGVAAA